MADEVGFSIGILVLGKKFWVPLSKPSADNFFGSGNSRSCGLKIDSNRIQDETPGQLLVDLFPLLRRRIRVRRIFFSHSDSAPTVRSSSQAQTRGDGARLRSPHRARPTIQK